MIPEAFITEWRQSYDWPFSEQVEQDLILSRILLDIFNDSELSEKLAFRGGTALQKLYFKTPIRYSEDIDLVQVKAEPIGNTINRIRQFIDPWLGNPSYKRNDGRFTLYYNFMTEIEPITRKKIKVEINTREHFSVLGYVEKEYEVNSSWTSGAVNIKTYQLEELLGTKLRALFQRKKGRDLLDLGVSLELFELNSNKILDCFFKYLEAIKVSQVSRAQFEQNLYQKYTNPSFLGDIAAMMSKNSIYLQKLENYKFEIYRQLIRFLPGDLWKGNFESYF